VKHTDEQLVIAMARHTHLLRRSTMREVVGQLTALVVNRRGHMFHLARVREIVPEAAAHG
jgi:hypothetical protein